MDKIQLIMGMMIVMMLLKYYDDKDFYDTDCDDDHDYNSTDEDDYDL